MGLCVSLPVIRVVFEQSFVVFAWLNAVHKKISFSVISCSEFPLQMLHYTNNGFCCYWSHFHLTTKNLITVIFNMAALSIGDQERRRLERLNSILLENKRLATPGLSHCWKFNWLASPWSLHVKYCIWILVLSLVLSWVSDVVLCIAICCWVLMVNISV